MAATSYTDDNVGGKAGMVVNNNDKLDYQVLMLVTVGKLGNKGFAERLRYINYDADAKVGGDAGRSISIGIPNQIGCRPTIQIASHYET